jgi:hypothetical protein
MERELPRPDQQNTRVHLDNASRRFRRQVTLWCDQPLFWLEDDCDVPDDFLEVWSRYERTLPADWKVAVIGWGAIYCVAEGWWQLHRINAKTYKHPVFGGTQAVLVNAGRWRLVRIVQRGKVQFEPTKSSTPRSYSPHGAVAETRYREGCSGCG